MATDKKLISVYVPDDVEEAIVQYQQEQGIKSASSAVVAALKGFFKLSADARLYVTLDRFEKLEGKLTA